MSFQIFWATFLGVQFFFAQDLCKNRVLLLLKFYKNNQFFSTFVKKIGNKLILMNKKKLV